MKTCSADFILVTFIYSLLLLLKCEANMVSKQFQAEVYDTMNNNASICHDGFMSVYISKVQFADLPFSIYVQDTDEHGRYYQAVALAKQCHYFLGESDTLIILTVSANGCFVRRQKYITSLTVVIVAPADKGKVEIVKTILLVCETKIKEANKEDYPPQSRQLFCNKGGFNITILKNATVPPLNLDAVWIPSSQNHLSHCKPKTTSSDAVTFSFPFTDCGTQSVIVDGIITYWINVEGKPLLQKGTIFRDTPFQGCSILQCFGEVLKEYRLLLRRQVPDSQFSFLLFSLTVQCSFALAQRSQLSIEVQREKHSTLKSKGILRTEMRFAKDSSYTSFYSSHDRPTVTELGQSVYVEIFILKHEDKDLVLLLENCWATPTQNPHDPHRWNLLVKGCSFAGDGHRTVVLPVVSSKEVTHPSHHKRFVVKMFSFVKQTSENRVYFHCDIEICKGPDCLQPCSSGRRKLRRIPSGPAQTILDSVVSGGPLLYKM